MSKDELQEQRVKRVDSITKKVTDGFQNEFDKQNYQQLLDRKYLLQDKLADAGVDVVTASNARLQLQEVEASLTELDKKIDWNSQYDTSVDDEAARKFLAKYDLLEDNEDMINSNDELDKLESELYNK